MTSRSKQRVYNQFIVRRMFFVLNGLWAIPAVLLIRLISPLLHVNVGTLEVSRIGHFVADGTEQVMRNDLSSRHTIELYWWDEPCNLQWDRMLRRELKVRRWARYLDLWNRHIPGGQDHSRPPTLTYSRDIEGLYGKSDKRPQFSPEEDSHARSWLRAHGWKDDEPFVCLMVRDASYLEESYTGSGKFGKDWTYHDYRNSDISSYAPAVEWLLDQKVWVLRMGSVMNSRLEVQSPRFIDYAFTEDRCDLMDIWLFANCSACISTATGPDNIPMVYSKPLLFVNALPLAHINSFADNEWVPKRLFHEESGKELTLREYVLASYVRTQDYSDAGIRIVDLSAEEVLTSVQEFWLETFASEQPFTQADSHQTEFWTELKALPDYDRRHGWINPRARLARWWLDSLS